MNRTVRLIGAPADYGANRRGVDMGPSALRYAGIADAIEAAGNRCVDDGDIGAVRAERRDPGDENAKFLDEVRDISDRIAAATSEACAAGEVPLVLGGDHSVAIGTLAGSSENADIGMIWFDAHGDFNTPETSPSGNVHGMPVAAALGRDSFAEMDWAQAPGLSEENVVYVGLRSLDDAERNGIRESEMKAYTMSDIDTRGIAPIVEEAIDIATDGTDGLHVSLDMDWLDPGDAPGVGTPVRGGVTYREAHAALELVADNAGDDLRSMEVVEVNPILDRNNETAELAVELVGSTLGKRVLR